tara:strand:+ start:1533 stop:2738 length:1206 start_codon:yes stop_codon:yes gene_type:complete
MGSCGCSGGMKDGKRCNCANCQRKRGYSARRRISGFYPDTNNRTRKFGNQRYTLLPLGGDMARTSLGRPLNQQGTFQSKETMRERAQVYRDAGYNARVIKLANGYSLWVSDKVRYSKQELDNIRMDMRERYADNQNTGNVEWRRLTESVPTQRLEPRLFNAEKSMTRGVKCGKCGRTPPYWTDTRLKSCGKCSREGREMTKQEKSDVDEILKMFPGSIRQFNSKKPTEVSGLRRNVMGTLSLTLKGGRMRKGKEFIVYPKNSNDSLPPYIFMIQSERRIGLMNMRTGQIIAAPPSNSMLGTSFLALQMAMSDGSLQSLGTMREDDRVAVIDALGATSQDWDEQSMIRTDNTGAGQDFFNALDPDKTREYSHPRWFVTPTPPSDVNDADNDGLHDDLEGFRL